MSAQKYNLRITLNAGADRNVAFIKGQINGDEINLGTVSGAASRKGAVDLPANGNRAFEVLTDSRNADTEVKLLEHIAQQYKSDPLSAKGTLRLVSDFEVCPSCEGVIKQFERMFPNIKLEVQWYKPKGYSE